MSNAKALFTASAFLVFCAVVVGVIVAKRQPELRQMTPVPASAIPVAQNPMIPSAPEGETKSPQIRQERPDLKNEASPAVNTSPSHPKPPVRATVSQPQHPPPVIATPAQSKRRNPKRELQDPMARKILGLVGADRNAEAYWLRAIFDTSLPDKERDDLIEDLNEEGLSDQKHPGPQDRNLILSRLILIEEVEPYADSLMLPHLQEARKDLLNLLEITQGGGEPVK